MPFIYHLVPRAAWEANPTAPYRAASLADEGFIHCSHADQVVWAANRFQRDAVELLVLAIDPARLTSPVRFEDAGGGRLFPHVYGPIDRAAVVAATPLTKDAGGAWIWDAAR
jgi:uncharacterized protein (DUF952 family)